MTMHTPLDSQPLRRLGPGGPTSLSATLLLTMLLLSVLVACGKGGDGNTAPVIAPPAVQGDTLQFASNSPQLAVLQVSEVKTQTEQEVELTGRVVWDETRTTRIFAPVAGRIVSLDAMPGQTVRVGQVLARLSAPDVGQAQADAARAAADAQQAERSLARARELEAAGAIPHRELETAEADQQRARAELARALARMRSLGAANSAAQAGEPSVDQQYALRSPVAGVVVERNANPGQEFRPDQAGPGVPPLFTVSDPNKVWVQFEVPEGQAPKLHPGQRIDIRIDALPEAMREARIEWVADTLDAQSRTLRVRVSLPNNDRSLKAEMFVRGVLHLPTSAPQPVVPTDATVFIQGRHYVFVELAPGQFKRKAVQALESGVGQMTIENGLAGGERVVTRGALMLQQVLTGAGR